MALAAVSCSQAYDVVKEQGVVLSGLPPELKPVSVSENFRSAPNGSALDILFVIDNSGSMKEEQANLALSFDAFIRDIQNADIDFQIGVISTDASRPEGSTVPTAWTNPSYMGSDRNITNLGTGSLLARGTNEKVLTKDTPNLVDQFKENVNLGITTYDAPTGYEMGIQALTNSFAPTLSAPGGWNAPLFRDNALLSLIIVSDEDESRAVRSDLKNFSEYLHRYPSEKNQRFAAFDEAAMALKSNRKGLLRVDSIISDPENPCGNSQGTGKAYSELTRDYGGKVFSICNEFSGILEEIGGALSSQALSTFALKNKPQSVSSLKLNGQVLVENVSYTVNKNNNTVTLIGDALTLVSTTPALIEITYVTLK